MPHSRALRSISTALLVSLASFVLFLLVACGTTSRSTTTTSGTPAPAPGSGTNGGTGGTGGTGGSGGTGGTGGTGGSGGGTGSGGGSATGAEYVFLGGPGAENVTSFKLNSSTGATQAVSTLAIPGDTRVGSIAISPDKRFVLVASSTYGDRVTLGKNSLDVFSIDPATGKLKKVSSIDPGANTGPIAIVGSHVFVPTSSDITTYNLNADGTLTRLSQEHEEVTPQTVTFPFYLHYDAARHLLWAVRWDTVRSFRVADDGTVSLLSVTPTGSTYVVAFTPDSHYMVVGNNSVERMELWRLNDDGTTTMTSTAADPVQFTFTQALVVDRTGTYAFGGFSEAIATYKIDPAAGTLTLVPPAQPISWPSYIPDLYVDTSNKWVISSLLSDSGGLAYFSIQPDGTLSQVAAPTTNSGSTVTGDKF